MGRGNQRRRRETHAGVKTEGAVKSLRKAGIWRAGESKAAVNCRHFSEGSTNLVRSARAASAAAREELTMNSVSLTCCSLAARTRTALTRGSTRRLTRAEALRGDFG